MTPDWQASVQAPGGRDVYEKYLDRILAKSESAKQDLEKNWMGQITSIALSLALVAGLGEVVARKLFDDPDRYSLLYLILPVVNTFLFVRFGHIGATFSKARYNAEKLTEELRRMNPFPDGFDVSQIYKTNSYFEWAHQEYSAETVLFLLTIPLVFSLNHSLTIYLLYKFIGLSWFFYVLATSYVGVCGICYWAYYRGNKDNTPVFVGKENLFIIVSILIAVVATVALLALLHHYDPRPGRIGAEAARTVPSRRTATTPHDHATAPSPTHPADAS